MLTKSKTVGIAYPTKSVFIGIARIRTHGIGSSVVDYHMRLLALVSESLLEDKCFSGDISDIRSIGNKKDVKHK